MFSVIIEKNISAELQNDMSSVDVTIVSKQSLEIQTFSYLEQIDRLISYIS